MARHQGKVSRRDFLKLASFVPAAWLSNPFLKFGDRFSHQNNIPNILILIFDAWSASNVSLYGYPRATMPNLERFADRAIVYHNHISAGTFTSPGVASILTGLYPWSHRAFQLGNPIVNSHIDHQMFSMLEGIFSTKLGYSHNNAAD